MDLIDELARRSHLAVQAVPRVRELSAGTGTRAAFVVTRLGLLSEEQLATALSEVAQVPRIEREDLRVDMDALALMNRQFLRQRRALPCVTDGAGLCLVMADPTDDATAAAVDFACEGKRRRAVATVSDIEDAWLALESADSESQGLSQDLSLPGLQADLADDAALLADHVSEAPVIRLVHRVVAKAVALHASDIHFEPGEHGLHIRYRVDGELGAEECYGRAWCEPVLSRIKLTAKLDIAQTRLPHDGRARVAVQGRPVDLRVATFPTLHGESAVLRILGRHAVVPDLKRIGLPPAGEANLRQALGQPNGLVLVTGPTGSGKTTTLYAALRLLARPQAKVVSVEDPIEYTLAGVTQMQVRPEIGLGFAEALRSVLRNDPDVIMVGEIRDSDTAQTAVRAALTGHLVLATLHTNSAAAAITRLLDLGVPHYLLASTITCTCAQRLLRRLCDQCKTWREATEQEAHLLRGSGEVTTDAASTLVPQASGCASCLQRGYTGRVPVFEALAVDDGNREALGVPFDEERFVVGSTSAAQTMWQHGLQLVREGTTTLAELVATVGRPPLDAPGWPAARPEQPAGRGVVT